MKFILPITTLAGIALLGCTPVFADISNTALKTGDTAYVSALGGLSIRTAPRKSARKLATIPYSKKVSLLSPPTVGEQIQVDGIWARWVKIGFKNKVGYVFAGYLSWKIAKNRSGITVNHHRPGERQSCRGSISSKVRLSEIGISPQELKTGLVCVAGDFDGDGYLDFLFYGKVTHRKNSDSYYKKFLIVFFNKNNIVRQIPFEFEKRLIWPALYEATNKTSRQGHPASKTDSFFDPGEGAADWVFIFDKKTNTFKATRVITSI